MNKGLQISGWLEHLPSDEMPPEKIWHHSDELNAWFERVKAERERKYSTSPAADSQEWETVPGAETVDFDVSEDVQELRGY